jgi:hypothetical protein
MRELAIDASGAQERESFSCCCFALLAARTNASLGLLFPACYRRMLMHEQIMISGCLAFEEESLSRKQRFHLSLFSHPVQARWP